MPDVRPFRGVRYDVAQVGALSDVVAPPYDVIDPALQERLYQASPYNIIRLELNRPEPGDSDVGESLYAGRGVPARTGSARGFSGRRTTPPFTCMSKPSTSRARLIRGKAFWPGFGSSRSARGQIFPHEQTLAGPKADRLALYQATGFNLSPIFGLYPDADHEVLRLLEAGLRDRTPLEATDHLGVVNRLWVVADDMTQTAVQGLMAAKPIFIADGHHRYETGLKYRDDARRGWAAGRPRRPGRSSA